MRTTYLPHIPRAGLDSGSTLAKALLIAIGLATIATVIAVKQWTYTGTPIPSLSQVGAIPPLPERTPLRIGPMKVTGETGAGAGLGAEVEAVIRLDHR